MKLLLDCPEQFWKSLESKQYLDAAWLFLVARVVHHSLVNEEEEETWTNHGIDVLEQFPLVQRQWDAINGFRAQISHKAIQSLREEMTVEVGFSLIHSFDKYLHSLGNNTRSHGAIPIGFHVLE